MYLPSSGGATVRRPNIGSAVARLQQLIARLAPVLFVLFGAREAWPQGITFNASTDVERREDVYTPARPWWISHADCLANDVFTFRPSLNDPSDPFEIWVGTDDCAANRGERPDARGQCWIVGRDDSPDTRPEVLVPVRNIVAKRLDDGVPPTDLPASVCDLSTEPDGQAVTFYFMLVDGDETAASATWDASTIGGTGFDTLGPEPPNTISVGVGESQLAISVGNINDDDDLERLEAFCVPRGTDGPVPEIPSSDDDTGTADAGTISGNPDGGTDINSGGTVTNTGLETEGIAPAACYSPIIRSGARPPLGFSCGVVSKDARTVRTNELLDGIPYAVGVTGQDILGNTGLLSDVQCGTPIPLNDFYEDYRANGGRGGGGFCGVSRAPVGNPTHGVAWLGVLVAGWVWRRTRPRA